MNDPIIFIPSAVLGLLFVGVYSFRCWRNGSNFNLATIINIVLQASGVVAGSLLIASTFSADLRNRLNGIDIYILISGIAVFAVSLQGLRRDVFPSAQSNISSGQHQDNE